MKFKLLLLGIISIVIVYLIYETNPPRNPYILSIYDKTTLNDPNYNDVIKQSLKKSNPSITYDTSFSKYNFEIENLKDYLLENKFTIKQAIRKADLIIIHLGKYELENGINYNSEVSKEILVDLEIIYKQLRKITSKNIIFIPPGNISQTLDKALNNLSADYHITYLNNHENTTNILISYLEKLNYL